MAESAPYRFDEADDFCTIVLLPELNKAPWGDIDSIGNSLLERMNARMTGSRHKPGFVVDLSALNYMGSAMVALVVRLWKAAKEQNAKMVVVNNDEMVLEVLRLAGLAQVWTIVPSREAALKSLGVTEKKPEPAGGAPAAPGAAAGPMSIAATPPANVTPWIVGTVVLLLAACAGLYLLATDPMPVEDMRIPLGLLFGGGVLGLIAATATASLGRDMPRTVGIACVLGMLALLGTGVYVHPQRDSLFKGRERNLKGVANNPNPPRKTAPGKTAPGKTPSGKTRSVKPDPKETHKVNTPMGEGKTKPQPKKSPTVPIPAPRPMSTGKP